LGKYGIAINVENVLTKLESKLAVFKEKYKLNKSETFKVAPKLMMNLLMTFESYDEQVVNKDMYMPEEKVINFNVGFLKLQFKGVFRITMDRMDKTKTKKQPMKEGEPNLAYGVVEKKDLYFRIDKPILLKHFFIRPNQEYHRDSKTKGIEINVIGLRNDVKVFENKKILNRDSRDWVSKAYIN